MFANTTLEIICQEKSILNRSKPGYMTAFEAAQLAATFLHGFDNFIVDDRGIQPATVRPPADIAFSITVTRPKSIAPKKFTHPKI